MGSSPRGRGPRGERLTDDTEGRLIPARAGTTDRDDHQNQRCEAHPRAGGDHNLSPNTAARRAGSSPRGRGPRPRGQRRLHVEGLIPARAGTTCPRTAGHRARRAHPRAGGDHSTVSIEPSVTLGSSPRGRGPRCEALARHAGARLIPARAGTTLCSRERSRSARAHPRAGGDHSVASFGVSPARGSSPRGRGPPAQGAREGGRLRLIPARAGTTGVRRGCAHPLGAHPRAGGDHSRGMASRSDSFGSSPRGRGPLADRQRCLLARRLIPARAGTTRTATWAPRSTSAHPRAGGDHPHCGAHPVLEPGSSPRGRGPRHPEVRDVALGRLIPARAGTTGRLQGLRCRWRAHPRAGGDHVMATLLES